MLERDHSSPRQSDYQEHQTYAGLLSGPHPLRSLCKGGRISQQVLHVAIWVW
jgi:hypothetical protein